MARCDNGDDKLWKEIAEEVHKDADKLFKMIGEAYAVLSDSIKVHAHYHYALCLFFHGSSFEDFSTSYHYHYALLKKTDFFFAAFTV